MWRWFERRVDPFAKSDERSFPDGLWAFLWAGTEGGRWSLFGMLVFAGGLGVFEAFLYALMGYLGDSLANVSPALWWSQHRSTLFFLALIIAASTLWMGVLSAFRHQSLAGNLPMRLRWRLHHLLLDQTLAFHYDEFAGRLATKLMQTALAVRDSCFILADTMVYAAIYFITISLLIVSFDGWLILPFVAWLLVYLTMLFFFVPRLIQVSRRQANARADMTGRITDAYANIVTIKLFSHTLRETQYVRSAMDQFLSTVHAQMRQVSAVVVCVHALSIALFLTVGALGLWRWQTGAIGAGVLLAALAVALRINGLSHWITWEMAALFEHIGTVQDGMNTFSGLRVQDDRGSAQLRVTGGALCFENVTFRYSGGNAGRAAIDGLSFSVRAGEKIGIVGRSGAGKSTLLNLLLRFYALDSGRILIDGQDIAEATQISLRQQIGMVSQDIALLHRSIAENIGYGCENASQAQIEAAARQAHAHEFILDQCDSQSRRAYAAHVGERGVKLSGGQRQRIALARVILKDAPILLLDEATSALDSEVEALIQASLSQLMAGKTVLAIAHRLSTIAAMDRLIVLDQGRIVEAGSHAQLLAHGGLYARLWARQRGGFLHDEALDDVAP